MKPNLNALIASRFQEHLPKVMDCVHSLENLERFRSNFTDSVIEMGRETAWGLVGEGESDQEHVATEQRYFG